MVDGLSCISILVSSGLFPSDNWNMYTSKIAASSSRVGLSSGCSNCFTSPLLSWASRRVFRLVLNSISEFHALNLSKWNANWGVTSVFPRKVSTCMWSSKLLRNMSDFVCRCWWAMFSSEPVWFLSSSVSLCYVWLSPSVIRMRFKSIWIVLVIKVCPTICFICVVNSSILTIVLSV